MGKRGAKHRPVEERIWKHIDKRGDHWIWTGRARRDNPNSMWLSESHPGGGYAGGVNIRKHLFSLYIHPVSKSSRMVSPRPNCGEEYCVNPAHMSLGKHDQHRIPNEDHDKIRERWALHLKHTTTLQKIANEYGVTRQRIEQIVNEKRVRHSKCTN